MSILHTSLAAWFEAEEAREAEEHGVPRLYYGSDLAPSSCERQAWFRLRGAPRKPLSLAERLMFAAGHRVEKLVVDAFRHAGVLVREQGQVRPVRPSAWAWSGRYDALVCEQRAHAAGVVDPPPERDRLVLVDVKTSRSFAFKKRDAFPKESHLWQLSAYYHEVRRRNPGLVRAELHYLDRDGSNQPLVCPLTEENGKLISEAAIVSEEARKAPLALPETPLPGLRADVVSGWYCNYCPYTETCKPEQHREYDGERREKVAAKKPRTPRKVLAPEAAPDPALSTARAVTDAAEARGAPPALDAPRQEPKRPPSAGPTGKAPADARAASDPCPTCSGTGRSRNGARACHDCLPTPQGLPGSGRRNPRLWPDAGPLTGAVRADPAAPAPPPPEGAPGPLGPASFPW